MSILDGMPRTAEDVQRVVESTASTAERILESMNPSAKERRIIELLKQGVSLADICGITSQERDAMFAEACRLLQAGQIERAHGRLMSLLMLDPLDARVIYAVAVTHQVQGDFSLAAKLYVHFIARQATNPEGHLRLGECLLSAREYDFAAQEFQIARDLCDRGKGDAAAASHAARMLAHAEEKRAARRPARELRNGAVA